MVHDKTFNSAHIPIFDYHSVSGITDTTAILGGNIIDDECAAITIRGIFLDTMVAYHCSNRRLEEAFLVMVR